MEKSSIKLRVVSKSMPLATTTDSLPEATAIAAHGEFSPRQLETQRVKRAEWKLNSQK